MEINLRNENKCFNNLRMSPDNLLHLHNILLGYGLKGTRETGSLECLGIYLWTCAHNLATRRSSDRFEQSLIQLVGRLVMSPRLCVGGHTLFLFQQTAVMLE